jgi:hypothetical protein
MAVYVSQTDLKLKFDLSAYDDLTGCTFEVQARVNNTTKTFTGHSLNGNVLEWSPADANDLDEAGTYVIDILITSPGGLQLPTDPVQLEVRKRRT